MPIKPISLGVSSNPGRYPAAGAARLINCHAEDAGTEGKTRWPIYAVSGLKSALTFPIDGGVRAMIVVDGFLYAVVGRSVYKIDGSYGYTRIGGLPTDGPVTMVRNRRQPSADIGIVSDGLYYAIRGGVMSLVNDPDLPAPSSITQLDGYFVLPTAGSDKWYVTSVNDALNIDALDFATAERYPDATMMSATRERELVFFGSQSIEWWQDTGAADFAFSPVQAIQTGCLAAGSVQQVDRTLVWIANDATVRRMDGYNGTRISTLAVERSIVGASDPTSITSFAYSKGGRQYYGIQDTTFCWVYDLNSGMWHERQSYGLKRWKCSTTVIFGNKVIAGDYASAKLYELSGSTYDEAGKPLIMTVQTPPIHAYPGRLRFNALYLDIIPGVGLNTTVAADLDPSVMMQWSEDGGVNWSSERQFAIGRQGNTKARVKAFRLGVAKEDGRTFKFTVSAAVAKGFTGAAVDAESMGT